MVRRGFNRNIRGRDDSDNPLYHSLKHAAEKIQKSPEDDFDKIFIVPDEEVFFIDDQEIAVENATHAMKGDEEYVLIDNTWYPVTHDTDDGIADVDDDESEPQIEQDYAPGNQSSGIGVLTIFFAALLIIGAFAFFIFPSMANSMEDPLVEKVTPTSGSSQVANDGSLKSTTITTTMITPIPTTTTPIEYIERSYHWTYGRHNPMFKISIPKPLYEYYKAQPHDNKKYAKYAITDKDRKVLNAIITSFRENSDSKSDTAYNIIAFVQSLPYVTDKVSTGYNDYARYPIETLVENGGDCEDTAILTAAFLKEMDYNVVLLRFPKHVAVGITCSDCTGRYYTYNDHNYFYLETTGTNWKVGQIPPDLKDEKNVKVLPM